jgi:hypothetical protein
MDEQPGYSNDDLRGHRILLPNVAFTTAKDWPEVINDLKGRMTAAMDSLALPKSLARQLAGTVEPEAKLDSIKAWVRERFNLVKFEHPDFMISFRPASHVLRSGYGHSLELAMLVADLCSRAGISAKPVPWFEFTPPVPYLYDLTGGLLFAQCGDQIVESDPLATRAEFPRKQLADASFIFLDGKGDITTRSPSLSENSGLRVTLNLEKLDGDTLRGTGMLVANGWSSPYEALSTDATDYVRNLLTLKNLEVTNVTVKMLEPEHTTVDFSFRCSALDTADGFSILPLSAMDFAQFAGHPNLQLETKEFPHWNVLPGAFDMHFEAPLPEGWNVTQKPDALSRVWKDGSGSRTVDVKNGRVVMDAQLTLKNLWIPPHDWSQFRSFLIETGPRPANQLVLTATP